MRLGGFPSLEFLEVQEGRYLFFFECLVKFICEVIWSRTFVCWEFLITASILPVIICLFRFSDCSWFSFGKLYVSRNLYTVSRLSHLLTLVVLSIFLQYFFGVSGYFSSFHFWFYVFGSALFFFSMSRMKCLSIFFIF